jgi:hypothetical protein
MSFHAVTRRSLFGSALLLGPLLRAGMATPPDPMLIAIRLTEAAERRTGPLGSSRQPVWLAGSSPQNGVRSGLLRPPCRCGSRCRADSRQTRQAGALTSVLPHSSLAITPAFYLGGWRSSYFANAPSSGLASKCSRSHAIVRA